MSLDESIPGYTERFDWPTRPVRPLRVKDHGDYRDGTYFFDLEDAVGNEFSFLLDRFLSRLCYGDVNYLSEAAFVRVGSKLEREVAEILTAFCGANPDCDRLRVWLVSFQRRSIHHSSESAEN